MKSIGVGLKAMIDDALTPESFKKGEQFEKYVRTYLFVSAYYDVVHKTHSYLDNKGDYVEESMKPDYLFRDKYSKKEFYVEVKFRSNSYQGKVEWCKNIYQLKRYKQLDKEKPVFILLGIEGEPSKPAYIFLIPMKEIKYTGLFYSFLENYLIDNKKAISSKVLRINTK